MHFFIFQVQHISVAHYSNKFIFINAVHYKCNDYSFKGHILCCLYQYSHIKELEFSRESPTLKWTRSLMQLREFADKKATIFKHIPSVRDELEMSWSE